MRPAIESHDYEAKVKIAKKLLANGDKVKVTVMFRGRQITHPDIGWRLLQRVSESLKEVASVERQPLLEGRRMHIILSAGQRTKTEEGVATIVNAKNQNS